jgi:hypothetical protein
LLLDHDGYLPTYAYISNGKKHDVTIARKVPLSPYSIITMDKGYNDYSLFAYWTENHIYFVTRLKDNADYTVVEEHAVPKNRNILADELILCQEKMSSYSSQGRCLGQRAKPENCTINKPPKIWRDHDRYYRQGNRCIFRWLGGHVWSTPGWRLTVWPRAERSCSAGGERVHRAVLLFHRRDGERQSLVPGR